MRTHLWRFVGLAFKIELAALIGGALMLGSAASWAAPSDDLRRQTAESIFKGHRLVTYIDEMTRQGSVELDGRRITAKDDVAEIGKISTFDLDTSFLYFLRVNTRTGCGSYIIVQVTLTAESGNNQVLTDFGACNDLLVVRTESRKGWGLWYAVAYRNDLATARIAFVLQNKLAIQELKTRPCLFTQSEQAACAQALLAEASGSGELGVPTGAGVFADHKIETFLNRQTDKATLKLDGQVYRTFDNAKDFYLAAAEGGTEFGLFVLFLKPAAGCATRPLLFFAERKSEPSITTEFAPCTDRMVNMMRRKGTATEWTGVAFHAGEPRGYIVSVADHKLSTRTTLLPACMMAGDRNSDNNCVLEALGQPVPSPSKPPELRVIPTPGAPRKPPRSTLGI